MRVFFFFEQGAKVDGDAPSREMGCHHARGGIGQRIWVVIAHRIHRNSEVSRLFEDEKQI